MELTEEDAHQGRCRSLIKSSLEVDLMFAILLLLIFSDVSGPSWGTEASLQGSKYGNQMKFKMKTDWLFLL